MRKAPTVLFVVFIPIFAMAAFGAQGGQTIRVAVKQVYLQVRAFDHGKSLKLRQENFRIWEEYKNEQGKVEKVEQAVEGFARYESVPMALAVTIDSSGSMGLYTSSAAEVPRNKLELARNASRNLFDSIFREQKDRGLVSEFYFESPRHVDEGGKHLVILTNLTVKQSWTPNLKEIYDGLGKIRRAGGATPIRDSVFNLAQHFREIDGDYLRVAVVLSDGEDAPDSARVGQIKINSHSLEEVIRELQNHQVMVFSIALYNKPMLNIRFGRNRADTMQSLAEETGGEAFYETDLSKLSGIFSKIGERIRDVNFLSYIPKSDIEGNRTIKVEVGEWDEKKEWHSQKASLHYRKGYYHKAQD
ncbi:MAG: VWA domain-containing protein [bacterium]|nr:VWA domain-containing protein [bacterium]